MSSEVSPSSKDHLTVVTDLSIRLAGEVNEDAAIRVATILNGVDTDRLRELDTTLEQLRIANRFDSPDGNKGASSEGEPELILAPEVGGTSESGELADLDSDSEESEMTFDIGNDSDDMGDLGEETEVSDTDSSGDGFLDSIEFPMEDEIGDGESLDVGMAPEVVETPKREASREALASARKKRVLETISGAPDRRRVASQIVSQDQQEAAVIEREFGLG